MLNGWFFLALCFAVMDWLALWLKKLRWNFLTKPAVLLCLIFWFTSQRGWQAAPLWFGLALIFSLAGDVLLLFPDRFFIYGLFTFLAAQVCYVIGFFPRSQVDGLPLVVIALSVLLIGNFLFSNLRKSVVRSHVQQQLVIPCFIYSMAISLMLFFAILTIAQPEWPSAAAALAATGGMLFFTSDALLSANRFIQPVPNGQLLVRILYHLGQLGLSAGVLLRFVK